MEEITCICKNFKVIGQKLNNDEVHLLLRPSYVQQILKNKGSILKIEESMIKILFPQYVTATASNANYYTLICNSCFTIMDIYFGQNNTVVINIHNQTEKSHSPSCKSRGLHFFFPFQLRRYVEFIQLEQQPSQVKNQNSIAIILNQENQSCQGITETDDDIEFQSLFGESNDCFIGSFQDFSNGAGSQSVAVANESA